MGSWGSLAVRSRSSFCGGISGPYCWPFSGPCFMGGRRLFGLGKFRRVASYPFPCRHQSHTPPACVLALLDLRLVGTCAVLVVVACAAAQEDLWPNLVWLMWVLCRCLRFVICDLCSLGAGVCDFHSSWGWAAAYPLGHKGGTRNGDSKGNG